MALRINKAIVRGWIDNTTPGETRGGIEILGMQRPIELVLRGNCLRDLAGSRLDFVNPDPQPQPEIIEDTTTVHRGVVGDMTASRRVKFPLIPAEQFEEYIKAKKAIPFDWRNSIYLEWYSLSNGRVVIEATGFELKLSGHQWEFDEKEEAKQKMDNRVMMEHFMELMMEASEAESQVRMDYIDPADEFEWEKRLRVRDTLEEAAIFLSQADSDDDYDELVDEQVQGRAKLVKMAHRLQSDVLMHLGKSFMDNGARGDLALAVGYIYDNVDEAWPEDELALESGFRIAILKRSIDACVVAIASCNILEQEDDDFKELRQGVFVLRDEMIDLIRKLRNESGGKKR